MVAGALARSAVAGPGTMIGMSDRCAVLWFRRDLRLADHPALLAAADRAETVLALYVLDERLIGPAGAPARPLSRAALP